MKRERKKEEKKRSEEKKVIGSNSSSGPSTHRAKALPLGHVEHTEKNCRNFIIKTFEPY